MIEIKYLKIDSYKKYNAISIFARIIFTTEQTYFDEKRYFNPQTTQLLYIKNEGKKNDGTYYKNRNTG